MAPKAGDFVYAITSPASITAARIGVAENAWCDDDTPPADRPNYFAGRLSRPMTRTLRFSTLLVCAIALVPLGGCSGDADLPPASIKGDQTTKTRQPKQDNRRPVVQVRTTAGEILLELDAEHAPVTVNNFLSYVNAGHYNDTVFHDVEDGFIALAGGYDVSLQEKTALFAIRNEAHNGLSNTRGTVAMARRPDVIDSSTAIFFFNVADNTALDHKGEEPQDYGYCVFGKVIDGMAVVDRIAKTPTSQVEQFERMPSERIAIQSIRRVR
jgi:cyclophilin family peptidyl-prolyl cis-trans isomerase